MRAIPAAFVFAGLLGIGCAHQAPATPRTMPSPGQSPARPVAATPAPPPHAGDIAALGADLLALTRQPGVSRGTWGIVVQDVERGEPLFALNPATLLVPASTAKLIAVASAADAVGWDFRYETTVRATGPIEDGVLRGDLVIVGSGDPSIDGRAGQDLSAWIGALNALGIRRIGGRIIGSDDAIEEPRPGAGWTWDDLGYRSGAIFGALNLRENQFTITVTPGVIPGTPPILTLPAYAEARPLINRTTTGAPGSPPLIWPEQRPGEPFLTIAGSVPASGTPRDLAVSAGNPTQWFADVFRQRLTAAGIDVTGPARDADDIFLDVAAHALPVLYTHRSATFREIVRPLLKDSLNLYAEAALRLNVAPGVFPTNDAALAGLARRLTAWGIPADGQQLVDGSGLSRRDVLSAATLVAVLRREYREDGESPWMQALPIAGVDGSLANRLRDTAARGIIRAKTGTMSNIRALAGYVLPPGGRPVAFAILLNDFEGAGVDATRAIDAMAARLAAFAIARP